MPLVDYVEVYRAPASSARPGAAQSVAFHRRYIINLVNRFPCSRRRKKRRGLFLLSSFPLFLGPPFRVFFISRSIDKDRAARVSMARLFSNQTIELSARRKEPGMENAPDRRDRCKTRSCAGPFLPRTIERFLQLRLSIAY